MNLVIKMSIALCALFLFSSLAKAQKFAYVDSEYILAQMPSYKSAQTQLDELSKEWQKEVDKKFNDIDKMYKEYQAMKILYTNDQKKKSENDIIEKEREAKKYQNDKFGFEGELFQKRTELVKPLQDKVYTAINNVAKSNGLDFIFDKSGDMLMLVSNPKYDRSDEVLEELGVVITEGKNNNLPGDSFDDKDLPPR